MEKPTVWVAAAEFFEVLRGLRGLFLSENPNLGSLEPLTALPKLIGLYLTLSNMENADLDPISRISSLQELHMATSNLGDISSLSKLTNLEILYLGTAGITSGVPALRTLTKAGDIDLGNNPQSPCSDLFELRDALPNAQIFPSNVRPGIDCAE